MKRTSINFLIDALGFAAFVLLASTGILMRYVLPAGSGRFATLWSMDRHAWGALHFWISVLFLAIVTLHLFLHWRWIICVIQGRPKDESGFRFGLSLLGVIGLLLLAFSPFLGEVEQTSEGGFGRGRLNTSGTNAPVTQSGQQKPEEQPLLNVRGIEIEIRGSMTLAELAQQSGVPLPHIVRALGLPSTISPDERLGQLRRRYGFEMNDVRKSIIEYKNQNQ